MDFTQTVFARRTVRDFKPRSVPDEVVLRIIQAGLAAPSNDHLRSWEFILVQDPARRALLLENVGKSFSEKEIEGFLHGWAQDRDQRDMYFEAVPKQYAMLATSPVLIIPCFKPGPEWIPARTLNDLNPLAAVWCCIQNMLLAAANEGIMGVTRIPFPPERSHVRQVLNLPPQWDFPCYLSLGYPQEGASSFRQKEVDAPSRVHKDKW